MSHLKRSERKELSSIIMSLSGVLRSKLSSQFCHRCVRTRRELNCGGIFIPWQSSSFLITWDRKLVASGVYALQMFHTTSNVYIYPKSSSHFNIIAGVTQYPHGKEKKNHKAPHQGEDTNYSTKSVLKIPKDKSSSYPVHLHSSVAQNDKENSNSFTFVEDIKMWKRYEKIHKELMDDNAMKMKQYEANINSILHKLSPPEEKALPIKQSSHKLSAEIPDAMGELGVTKQPNEKELPIKQWSHKSSEEISDAMGVTKQPNEKELPIKQWSHKSSEEISDAMGELGVTKQPKRSGQKKPRTEVVRYPFMNMSRAVPRKTLSFKATKAFLESLNIPCDELVYYPDIQTMTKDEILDSLILLKKNGLHNIFSLFLIQRIFLEKNLPVINTASTSKYLRKGYIKLFCYKDMETYLDLCKDLECPDLDIRHLMDRFANIGQFLTIKAVSLKIKQLKSLGARSKDILDNLEELFSGPKGLERRIKLYLSVKKDTQAVFPIKLFLIKNMDEFMEKLGIGPEVIEVAKLLGVSVETFQECWGFRDLDFNTLRYKIRKCLIAGIPQKEIFNNIPSLDIMTIEKCYAVTSSFRSSGLPVSLLVLNHMGDAAGANSWGNSNNNSKDNANGNNNNKVTDCESNAESSNTDSSCLSFQHQDWTGEALEPLSENTAEEQQASLALERETQTTQAHKKDNSSENQAKEVCRLISHLLQLEKGLFGSMFACFIKLDNTNVLDVKKNFDLLLSLNFTRENLATCPLVLAHPHEELAAVVRKVDEMITIHFNSFLSSSSSLSFLKDSSVEFTTDDFITDLDSQREKDKEIKQALFSCPTKHLNTIQYFLERENSFYLSAVGHQTLGRFLNLK